MAENRGQFLKFIWKVDNFSYIWNKTDNFVQSPDFNLDVFEGSAWCLKLYPRGRPWYENYVSVYLERLSSSEGPLEIKIDYEIALLGPNGAIGYVKEMKDRLFKRGDKYGFDNLVDRERLLGTPDDVLTLRCCIFPKNAKLKTYTEVIAKTNTEIERFLLECKAIDYTKDNSISLRKTSPKNVRLNLRVNREFHREPDVLGCHFSDAKDLKAFHCKIGILDSNNSVVTILINQFFDIESATGCTTRYLYLPLITVPELLKNKCLYLPNDKLNLDCELTLCYGLQHSQIVRIAHDESFMPAPVAETASTSQIDVPPKRCLYCIDNIPSSLKNDFQNLLQEGTLSDFTIKVGDKNVQAHKAVLCARSPVFKSMLTSNVKENEKNMVAISDLEEETVHRMLKFMYSDMAGNLDWEAANKLYVAGDKYCLSTLKRVCAEVLKQNLSVSNVGEVLVLGNRHSDEYLKKITVDFICDHETEVMRSTEWKTFMTEEVHLAAETMHHVFLKKAENYH